MCADRILIGEWKRRRCSSRKTSEPKGSVAIAVFTVHWDKRSHPGWRNLGALREKEEVVEWMLIIPTKPRREFF